MNFTIKQMLAALVLMGVLVVLALSVTSLNSNSKLISSKNRLTEIVLPLKNANQKIEATIATFRIRQGQIIVANTLEEVEQVSQRHYLEQKFEKWLLQLKTLSSKIPSVEQEIAKLTKAYAKFLKIDATIFASIYNGLKLKNDMTAKLEILDKVGTQLQTNAEAISGKINLDTMRKTLVIRQYLNDEAKTAELHQAIMELFQGNLTSTQKACYDLRAAVSSLSTDGRQLLLAKTKAQIMSIQDNHIAQASRLIQNSLDVLKKELEKSKLIATVQEVENDFSRLKSLLIEEEYSVAALRNQWLIEQQSLSQHRSLLKENVDAIIASLKRLQLLSEDVRKQIEQESAKSIKMAERIIGIVSVMAVLFMVIAGTLVARRVIAPINKASKFAHTISTGDFTAKIHLNQKDEIGSLVLELGKMANNLKSLVSQIQRSGIQVTSSSTELAATAKQQKATMLSQVESTNKVEKSVEEISNVAAELVQTVQHVAAMSVETAEFACSGQTDLSRMDAAMQSMENASQTISGKLEAINEKTENITKVVTTITKVADQTNLLSLNAAIEAEKAGEYGRGFNVVAREIRRLADQTAVATLDIEQMVKEMQLAVSAGVTEMDNFITDVQRSAEDVGKISTQLNKIIEQVQGLSPRFEEVNVAMAHQSQNAQNINNTMVDVSEGMRQTAESLEESFRAIEQLNEAARGLQDEVSRFKV